jgi:alpha-1,2-mannosyltransferase
VVYQLEALELPRLLNITGLIPEVSTTLSARDEAPAIDLTPIREFGLRLCVGKEWHRFPGHYLIPTGIDVRFIKSEFNGLVPGRFPDRDSNASILDRAVGTRIVPEQQNDLNKEVLSHYVSRALDVISP